MDYKRSLISKIAEKGVFTPHEAILIQYLNSLHIKRQISVMNDVENTYLTSQNIHSLYSNSDLKQILAFNTLKDAQEYDVLRWAANLMVRYDDGSYKTLSRCLALSSEMKYFRNEFISCLEGKNYTPYPGSLLNYVGFSSVHGQTLSFSDLLRSYALTLRILVVTADNAFTLNYFLSGIAQTDELQCIQNLKTAFAQGSINLNLSQETQKLIIDTAIKDNHPEFIEYLRENIRFLNWKVSPGFEKESLNYVLSNLL